MSLIRLGVVGAGKIWEATHKDVLNSYSDSIKISAFTVRRDEVKVELLKEYPDAIFYKDYQQMLKSDEIDAVLILTPIALNAKFTIDALKAKKQVFAEKPLSATAKEAESIIVLEKEMKSILYI